MPLNISFILFDGGLLNSEFATIAYSGVMFLGVGDVVAALYGKKYGYSKWVEGGSKTVEGSLACMFCLSFGYLLLC